MERWKLAGIAKQQTIYLSLFKMSKAQELIWARKMIWSVSFHRRLQSEYKVIKEKLLSLQNWETNRDHQRGWPIRLMVWWLGDDEYLILVDMKCLAGVPLCDRMAVLLISVIFTARVLTTDIWVTLIVWSSWCSASSHHWLTQPYKDSLKCLIGQELRLCHNKKKLVLIWIMI